MNNKIIKVSLATFAMIIVMLLAANNYMYNNGLSGKYINTEPKEGQMKVACVGDSITYGHGISDWTKNSYPVLLQGLLGDTYHVANFGSSGACVNPDGDQPYEGREIYQAALAYKPDIIVVMMGTNDSKPENWTNEDDFMEDYLALIASFCSDENVPEVYIALTTEAYFMEDQDKSAGIASYDVQPEKIDLIAEAVKMYAENSEVVSAVIDTHTLSEKHPDWFETDGVHPNNEGAKAIAELIAEAINK